MDIRFKWNMFITSFIPLWLTIIIANIWDIAEYIIVRWHYLYSPQFDFSGAVIRFLKANMLMLATIIIIFIMVTFSVIEITRFLKHKEQEQNSPKARLVRVSRANKLSAEFLLAYILPMIAFDFSDAKSMLLFTIYFFVLAYLCIRNNNVYTNIYLELKKYRMYECDVECRVMDDSKIYEGSLVISRRDLVTRIDGDLKYWDFDNYIYIDLEMDS